MTYNVSINENERIITVTLEGGSKGVAKCCPTDSFNINTGIELALERAKNAQKRANAPTKAPTVMELVKALEEALPKGEMVIVGAGEEMSAKQKEWLASVAGVSNKCKGSCAKYKEVYDKGYDEGYDEGYDVGYAEGSADALANAEEEVNEALNCIREILEENGVI